MPSCKGGTKSNSCATSSKPITIPGSQEIFPGARKFILHQNYRSTPQILAVCQNLIRHNRKKIEKILTTDNPEGEGVIVLECLSEEDEALQAGREIQDLVDLEETLRYLDTVLYGRYFRGSQLKTCLDEMGWKDGNLTILEGRRYQFKGLVKRVE